MKFFGPRINGKRIWTLRDLAEFRGYQVKRKLICSWRGCDWRKKLSGTICERCRRFKHY